MKGIRTASFAIAGLFIGSWMQAQTLTLPSITIPEGTENGKTITVTSTVDFNSINLSNWHLYGLPGGVNFSIVRHSNPNHNIADIHLIGNRQTDYERDSTFRLIVDSLGLSSCTGPNVSATGGPVTFKAYIDNITMTGNAYEGLENGRKAIVILHGDSLIASLDTSKWTVINIPGGVTKGNIQKVNDTTAWIILKGNRTVDYDTNYNHLKVIIDPSQFRHVTHSLSTTTGFVFTAYIEHLIMNGSANEGNENGTQITIYIKGDTLIRPSLNKANWNISTLPSGVVIDTVKRINDTTAYVMLKGNRNVSYNVDLTPGLTVNLNQFIVPTINNLTVSSGLTLHSYIENITMNTGSVYEGKENGALIDVILHGDSLKSAPLDTSAWKPSWLPSGITVDTVFRISNFEGKVRLKGYRTVDYTSDQLIGITVKASQFKVVTTDLTSNAAFTFKNVLETMTISGTGNESNESNDSVGVSLHYAKFVNSFNPANWSLSNLPQGVTMGSINRRNDSTVYIHFSGNRTKDYDFNITNLGLSIIKDQVISSVVDLSANAGFTFIANVDTAKIAISGSVNESSENGALINVNLTGATFINTFDTSKWVLTNLPVGVLKGIITRISPNQATIQLIGNRTQDYDHNIIPHLTIKSTQYDDHSVINIDATALSGFTFIALNDTARISLSGSANESAENNKLITVTITGGTFKTTLNPAAWTVTNLPFGVSKGIVSRISNSQVTIVLSGNRRVDYDSNINNLAVSILPTEYDDNYLGLTLSANSGFTFIAVNDPESLVLSGSAKESHESDSVIRVRIVGGTLRLTLNQAQWFVTGLPVGVSKGSVTRSTDTTATIQLLGTRIVDYDVDKFPTVTIDTTQYDDSRGKNSISGTGGFRFIAVNDPESLSYSWANPPGSNGLEATIGRDSILVTINGGTFYPAKINISNIHLSGNATTDAGISIKHLSGATIGQFYLALASIGRDYDINKVLKITVDSAAYAVADSVAITKYVVLPATFEPAALIITDDGGVIEAKQNGHILHIALQQDTFILAQLNTSNISITGQPFGITIGSINPVDVNHFDIVLKGNSYWDYDAPITATIHILDTALVQHKGGAISQNYIFSAINDPALLSLQWDPVRATNGLEPTLNGEQLIVHIAGATFDSTKINISTVKLLGNPLADYGLHIKSIGASTRDSFRITLAWDTIDFDVNKNLIVWIDSSAYRFALAPITANITVTAVVEPKYFTYSWANPPGLNGNEATLNNDVVSVHFNGGTLKANKINLTTIRRSGSARYYGVDVASISNITKFNFLLHLSWDSTVYHNDKKLIITMDTSAYYASSIPKTDTIILPATYLPEYLNMHFSKPASLYRLEEKLDTSIIRVTLSGGSLVQSHLNTSHVTLSGNAVAEAGLSIRSINWLSRTAFDLALAWNHKDFDVDKFLNVKIDTSAYRDGDTAIIGRIRIPATVEKVSFTKGKTAQQSQIQLGYDTLELYLFGAKWRNADLGNKYISANSDTLINGITHFNGIINNQSKLQTALKANKTGGYNNSIYRLNDTVLVITIPAIGNFLVQKNEQFNIYISPKLLVGTIGAIISDTMTIFETSQISATLSGGGNICMDGHSKARIFVALGGTNPWNLYLSNTAGNWRRAFLNQNNPIFSFDLDTTGIVQVDSLRDKNFVIMNPDVKLVGNPSVVVHNLPGPIGFSSSLRTTYSISENPVNITAAGIPFIGNNSSHGFYSGSGIIEQNNNYFFYGSAAWLSTPTPTGTSRKFFTITYHYTDSVWGCTNIDTTTLTVISANGTIDTRDHKFYYCYSNDTVRIFGSNSFNDPAGIFSIDSIAGSALINLGNNQALLYPGKFPSTQQDYTISYKFYSTNHTDSVTIQKDLTIESKPQLDFVTAPDSILCAYSAPLPIASNNSSASLNGKGISFNLQTNKWFYTPNKILPVIHGNQTSILDTITMNYVSSSSAKCASSKQLIRKVLGLPTVSFGLVDSCFSQTDNIQFINQTANMNMVSGWKWDFGDDQVPISENTDTASSPSHHYTTSGAKIVSLNATVPSSDLTCQAQFTKSINMGKKPIPVFTWNNECFLPGDSISFSIDNSNGTMTSKDKFSWIFTEGLNIDTVKTDLTTPARYSFSRQGSFVIQLLDVTQGLCRGSASKTINLRPTITPTLDSSYSEDFESGKRGWFPDANANSSGMSWKFGIPDFSIITPSISGDSSWYVPLKLNQPTSYTEQSWISSPCFDFSKLKRPMIKLNLLRNMSAGSAGAVLQYSDNNSTWQNVGSLNDAKEWFNTYQLTDKLNQAQVIGWSGGIPDTNWVEARHWFDNILLGNKHIRFRIEFLYDGSIGSNTGFAFDNVWIGERTRRVVMEHFISGTSSTSQSAEHAFTNLVFSHPLDVSGIQYHLNISGADPLYNDNPDDPSARLLYYGIFLAPYSFMDGPKPFGREYDYISNPLPNQSINDNDLFVRSLVDPEFSVKVVMTNNAGIYAITDSITALHNIPSSRKIIVQNAIVEKRVTLNGVEYHDVLKKMLPDASGSYPVTQWTAGNTITLTVTGTPYNVYNASELFAVVFLQDAKTKEILQAASTDTSSISTGIEDLQLTSEENGFTIYPNPANDRVYFVLKNQLKVSAYFTIYNMVGTVMKIITIQAFQHSVEVDLTGFRSGMYIVKPNEPGIPAQRLVITK
jgi:hypothetical protein